MNKITNLNMKKAKSFLFIIIHFLINNILFQISKIYSYTVDCDYMGDCSFIIQDKKFNISPRHIPLYKEISSENIEYKWNNTYYLLKLEKQIDGVSNYGLLKGTKNGYECSGGLSECKDSCCLDGFCVEILFFCDKENEHVSLVYLIIGIFFVILIVLYWFTFCLLGCKYKDDLTKTMKEEEEFYLFMKINKIKSSTNSASITENYSSQIPIMNNVIKFKSNVLKN